jgi:hypothetical protein
MARKKEVPRVVEDLREAIRRSGQSLNQISKLSGIDSGRLSRFMRGQRDLTFTAAGRVCDALCLRLAPEEGGESQPAPGEVAGEAQEEPKVRRARKPRGG